jgi:peptidoglycan/LPS O-acetylase OafA/YrhL
MTGAPDRTVRSTFDPRSNAITPMRLALALLVVFSHAFPAGGFGPDPLLATTGQLQFGTVAVIAFFGLSGFLLARSRESSSLAAFARNRLLRLGPGLWVHLLVLGVVLIPLAVALGGRASPNEVVRYVVAIGSFQIAPLAIGGLYAGSGAPDLVNPPLWTLAPEFYCYVGLAIVGISSRVLRVFVLELLLVFVALNVALRGASLYVHLPVAFLTGAALWVYGDRLPLTPRLALIAGAVTVAAAAIGALALVAPLTLPYIAVWLSTASALRLTSDLSYGVYIYAWPIQAILAEAGLARSGLFVYLAATLVVLLPVAAASHRLVEQPALRLRSRRSEQPVAPTRLAGATARDRVEPLSSSTP